MSKISQEEQILDISPMAAHLHDWTTLKMSNNGANMKNLNQDETLKVSGGASNLEFEIPQGFKLLIEAIEEYASFPKEFALVLENRANFEPTRGRNYSRRPQRMDP